MNCMRKLWVWVLVLCSVAGCTGPPAAKETAEPAEPATAYDPEKDPLVNPPEIFELYPWDDLDRVDDDATYLAHLASEPTSLNPLLAVTLYDWNIVARAYSFVYVRDHTMEFVPDTFRVEGVEESDDHMTFRVHLKPGLKWHDGQPWTSHDVRFTWEAINDPQVPAVAHKFRASQLADVRVIDDLTFEFVHKEATPVGKMNMSFPIIPKHIFGNPEERAKDPSMSKSEYYNRLGRERMVGASNYKFVEWVTNDRIVFERWDEYEKGDRRRATFKRYIYKIQPDPNVAFLLFKKGELHGLGLRPQVFATQTQDEDFARIGVKGMAPLRFLAFIEWNQDGSNPFFTDRRVRRAMAHAYDHGRVLEEVLYNLSKPAYGLFGPEHWAFNPEVKLLDFDLDQAAELLDEAGWTVSEDDGWRYREVEGHPVKFEFELIIGQAFADAMKMSEIFRNDLRTIGVSLKTRHIEDASIANRARAHDYQALAGTSLVSGDPDDWRNGYHSDAIENGQNDRSYRNARVDELFELQRIEFDREKRAAYFRDIHRLIYEDQPDLYLWQYQFMYAFHKNVRGVRYSPSGISLFWRGEEGGMWFPKLPTGQ